jgi:hypothetical protein
VDSLQPGMVSYTGTQSAIYSAPMGRMSIAWPSSR